MPSHASQGGGLPLGMSLTVKAACILRLFNQFMILSGALPSVRYTCAAPSGKEGKQRGLGKGHLTISPLLPLVLCSDSPGSLCWVQHLLAAQQRRGAAWVQQRFDQGTLWGTCLQHWSICASMRCASCRRLPQSSTPTHNRSGRCTDTR